MTKAQLLRETIDYYSVNPKQRRCLNKNDVCVYSPITANKVGKSEGCAIGRLLSPEDALLFDEGRDEDIGTSLSTIAENYPKFMEKLPKNVRRLGVQFLSRIQVLHDVSSYWEKKGLSEYGIKAVNSIIDAYNVKMKHLK